jgi:hypothetical protein
MLASLYPSFFLLVVVALGPFGMVCENNNEEDEKESSLTFFLLLLFNTN